LNCKAGGRENRNLPNLHNDRPIDSAGEILYTSKNVTTMLEDDF